MIKRPIMSACAGFLVVLVALLLLFLSDEEVEQDNVEQDNNCSQINRNESKNINL